MIFQTPLRRGFFVSENLVFQCLVWSIRILAPRFLKLLMRQKLSSRHEGEISFRAMWTDNKKNCRFRCSIKNRSLNSPDDKFCQQILLSNHVAAAGIQTVSTKFFSTLLKIKIPARRRKIVVTTLIPYSASDGIPVEKKACLKLSRIGTTGFST